MIKQFLIKTLAGAGVFATIAAGAVMFADNASAMTPTAGGSTIEQVMPPAPPTPSTAALNDSEHWPAAIEGRPTKLDDGSARGWYFWHDGNGLHLDTTTPQDKGHVFEAVLTTKGTFRDIDKIHLEGADDVKLLDNGHKLVVQFHTYDGIDGVNFHIDGGDSLRLRLDEGGHLIDRSSIFIGHGNAHPWNDPFTIDR